MHDVLHIAIFPLVIVAPIILASHASTAPLLVLLYRIFLCRLFFLLHSSHPYLDQVPKTRKQRKQELIGKKTYEKSYILAKIQQQAGINKLLLWCVHYNKFKMYFTVRTLLLFSKFDFNVQDEK